MLSVLIFSTWTFSIGEVSGVAEGPIGIPSDHAKSYELYSINLINFL